MWLRFAVGWLPGFLLTAGIGLLVVSPLSWGAGAHAHLPAWLPPLIGVVFAVPASLLGFVTLRAVASKARERVLVHFLPLAFGALLIFGGAMAVWGLVVSLPNPVTYNAILEPPAVSPDAPASFLAAQRSVQFQEGVSVEGLVAISCLVSTILFAWVWAASYAYTTAFQADPIMKFEAEELYRGDVVEMLARRERNSKTPVS